MKKPGLSPFFYKDVLEAGCDEAGRGCLAGPVVAAAVVLDRKNIPEGLNDSKKLSASRRTSLSEEIKEKALAWAIGEASAKEIDKINILNASFLAMHRALDLLTVRPEFLLIDGNRFAPYCDTPFQCMIKGDARFASIAAASILAKTHRDILMLSIHEEYPVYGWSSNMGYPTLFHKSAIQQHGLSPWHRQTFNWKPRDIQLSLNL